MQTKRQSLIETCTNTFVGMAGSFAITLTTINLVKDPLTASVITVVLCTVWSLVRGYVIRRRFNQLSLSPAQAAEIFGICTLCEGKGERMILACHVRDDEDWVKCEQCKGSGRSHEKPHR